MAAVPVILKCEPVSRLDRAYRRSRNPTVAVVYATPDGAVDVLDDGRPMRFADQLAGRYRYRYEVDLGDHHRTVELRSSPPPARGGVFHFDTLVNVGFRVSDPGQVVRRNLRDALQVVCDHLMYEFRNITAQFPIDAAKDAEDAVNQRFGGGVQIGGCLELYLCRARLQPDPSARRYLRAEQEAWHTNIVEAAEHDLHADQARRHNELDMIRQSGELQRRSRERETLAGRPFDLQDMLARHLENDPTDTANALQMAADIQARQAAYAEAAEQRQWQKFEFMTNHNLVQAIDVNQVRDQIVGGLSHPAARLPAAAAAAWEEPLPDAARRAPVASGHPELGGAGPDADTGKLPGLIPVYLVIEESSTLSGGIEALNAGLRAVYDAVVGHPDIASVVRLAVLSYADRAAVRLALQAVHRGLPMPVLAANPAPVRLSAAFERLLDCIPRDAATLKAQTPSLRRPQVLLLSGGAGTDDGGWAPAHQALVDRRHQRYAPDVTVCGVGDADPRTILRLATGPKLAFVAPPADIPAAVHRFCGFAQRRILEYGRAVLDGDPYADLTGPDGFRPAAELISTSTPEE